ncbi:sensor histidine kinase [Thermodesulfobacteriota bacterium]
MKRLGILMVIFFVALIIPLAYFVQRTYRSLEQEEVAELTFFANTLFDEMEKGLASMVLREEDRGIDEYDHFMSPSDHQEDAASGRHSPLSVVPAEPYVLGYFQNNPDGSFQTPLVESQDAIPLEKVPLVVELSRINELFNPKRSQGPEPVPIPAPEIQVKKQKEEVTSIADKYLFSSRSRQPKSHLGQESVRYEKITADQALNLGKQESRKDDTDAEPEVLLDERRQAAPSQSRKSGATGWAEEKELPPDKKPSVLPEGIVEPLITGATFRAEVDPMQSVFIDEGHVFLYRRIVVNDSVYRQGLVLKVPRFLEHLIEVHFSSQPMARFTHLRLQVTDRDREIASVATGSTIGVPLFTMTRAFPRPFSFLNSTLSCERIPRSSGRSTLSAMVILLAAIILVGFFAIYHSMRVLVDHSERRSGFVSSVTHELKTPLTSIRMYIEMLEQGIAGSPDREQEYFRILGSETTRLSHLISNVLEFSRLEKKQRPFQLREGNFEDVIRDFSDAYSHKLSQEGFSFTVEIEKDLLFTYDREVMMQILINLAENSIKFGKGSLEKMIALSLKKEGGRVKLSVSDTGPGIPQHALKKVFGDFYRVEGALMRTTKGTGIGLALVKKYVTALGGSVAARNNDRAGCTISLTLPS